MNRFRAVSGRIVIATMLLILFCRTAMADPVEVDSLHLNSQSTLTGPIATYGNRIGTPYHETSLKRVEPNGPWWLAPNGGLLQMFSSLDLLGEGWAIAEKGDRVPGGNGVGIPYVRQGEVPPPPALIPTEIFYVAFAWNYNFTTTSGNEIYGWAKLQAPPPVLPTPTNPQGIFNPDLILLASATTTDDRGIIVGEYRVIPEPTAFAIMAVGATLLMQCKRRGLL